MKLFVVIPNWNSIDFIADCLDALAKQTQPHQVILVDNGSTDGSKELVKERYPDIRVIELDRNYGFAGGVNRGIKPALNEGADLIALLNNDAVADPDWLKNLVEAAEKHPEAGIITSKIVRTNGLLDSTGDFYSSWGFPFPRGRDEEDRGQYDSQTEIFGASGGASLYRAEMLRQIGLFDEEFFAYYEDVDISFRAQLAGWKVRYEPGAVVHHQVGGTSGKLHGFARYHSVKNFFLLYGKNMPGRLYWKYLPKFLIATLMLAGNDLRRRQFGTFLKAAAKATALIPFAIRERRRIQKQRKVSARYIDSILYHPLPPTQKQTLALLGRLKLK